MVSFIPLTARQQKILHAFLKGGTLQSSDIHKDLISSEGEPISVPTVKRALSELESLGALKIFGGGRSTAYSITDHGRMILHVDAHAYSSIDPDKRHGLAAYNFGLFDSATFDLFTADELKALDSATEAYKERVSDLSLAIREKELERFIIELSWKSSKIEGNTYTLLDTEKLILRGVEAPGHDKDEARMILNHKDAFKFIREHAAMFTELTRANMEGVHKLLIHGLNVNLGLRSKPVGVTGSTYRPLDNLHQIAEAVGALSKAVSRMTTPYGKALLTLLGISYIQPFEDGNKRTGRLMANAILLAHGCAPLSYRSVEESAYREATLAFYELNSLVPFKQIFMDQYLFAAKNYLIGQD